MTEEKPITVRCLDCRNLFSYVPCIRDGVETFPRIRCDKCDIAAAEFTKRTGRTLYGQEA